MFKIEFDASITPVLEQCLGDYTALTQGEPRIWQNLAHNEATQAIQALWEQMSVHSGVQDTSRTAISGTYDLRQLVKALEVHIHLNDGRFCSTLGVLAEVIDRHANPFALRQAFAQAEDAYRANGASEHKQGLESLRQLTLDLKLMLDSKCFNEDQGLGTLCDLVRFEWLGPSLPRAVALSC